MRLATTARRAGRVVVTALVHASALVCLAVLVSLVWILLYWYVYLWVIEVADDPSLGENILQLSNPVVVLSAGTMVLALLLLTRTVLRAATEGREALLAAVVPVDAEDPDGTTDVDEDGRLLAKLGEDAQSDDDVVYTSSSDDPPYTMLFEFARNLFTFSGPEATASRPDESDAAEPLSAVKCSRFVETTRRLAAQADVTCPTLGVHPSPSPLCYTVDHESRVFLVVSRGLVHTLSADELEAVLAHEIAHVANGDNRLMTWTSAPLIVAERVAAMDGPVRRKMKWAGRIAVPWVTLGTGVFSRGREFAADEAAARLTGDPGALASALERLDGSLDGPPPEDLRDHLHTRDALNVLPALDPDADGGGGLLATHPATEDRIERLRALERAQETA